MSAAHSQFFKFWRREWPLPLIILTLALALLGKRGITAALEQPAMLIALLTIICSVILVAAVALVRHEEVLAHRWGDHAGTLLLTLTITGLEVAMVAFVMSTGAEKPTLARDTMFAVVMLVLNGFIGLALLLGGMRHREQSYNLQSASIFLVMIVPFTVLSLVLPNFTRATPGPTLAPFQMIFLSVMGPLLVRTGLVALIMLAGAMWLFHRTQHAGGESLAAARTAVINVIVVVEIVYLFNCRSLNHSFLRAGVFTNLPAIYGVVAMIALQLLFTYAPFMNQLFHTAPISAESWFRVVAVAAVTFVAVEVEKAIRARSFVA